MKFNCSTIINKPLEDVTKAFLDIESMKFSHKGFIDKYLIEGNPNEVGSKYTLKFEKFEMTEAILENNLPHFFSGLYEHKHMSNTMITFFEAIDKTKTKFSSEIEYTEFKGILIIIMSKLFPSMFRKQGEKWLERFKIYVENL